MKIKNSTINKSVLVTGGSGFIGSNFVRHFYHAYPDYRVVNLDFLTYAGNTDNLKDIEELEKGILPDERRYQFVQGDICDVEILAKLFEKYNFEFVFNFAAETHVDRSIMGISDFIRTNISGVCALIEAVRRNKTTRFVHISTDEVYGSTVRGGADEDAPFRPASPYAASKAAADLIVQAFMRTHSVPTVILRGSNNYGPFQYPEKLIPLAISNVIDGRKIPVHGTGEHVRSWLNVNDFCRAVDLVARRAPDYGIYNVSGEEMTNLEILQKVVSHLDIRLADHKEHVSDRPNADLRYAPDSTKIRRELGWAPEENVEKSLGNVVAWYLTNQDWLKKIKSRREYQYIYEKQSRGQWY
ncbi:dTDP-glucose 4,6-dehydratase [Candidatus Wolfebacteria bacterium RIFCSPLOWO2_01_FULL_47_17b]|uniref:dTDP-glucose 4,6-dehydratase n=1 Tax=Candidatus Wolfebacteria bacterium RIFCSPLOWO2_01_FULL_47_17b TaxID=1802558 RepID=A0A1F8DYU0_9BACT|nr:MAG: dTDP-glucose 4,6-dehydratase [Candidatus Wolfebacteria bacterium RIFCSPLOWO2_01_FULL_47_17b]